MAGLKIVIGDPKTGKCEQRELSEEESKILMGKKLGDEIDGKPLGFEQNLMITGGSDNCGFPMRRDVSGTGRKRILIIRSVGFRGKEKGIKKRKTVCGNMIHARIAQVNLKIMKPKEKKAKKKKVAKKPKKEVKSKEKKPKGKPEKKESKEKKETAEKKDTQVKKENEK